MSPLLISLAAFVAVSCLVGAVAMLLRGGGDEKLEGRLDVLTGLSTANTAKDILAQESVLSRPLDDGLGLFERIVARIGSLQLLFEQADTKMTPAKFFAASAGIGATAALVAVFSGINIAFAPIAGIMMSGLPLLWLIFRRSRRMKAFAKQLPDALELLGRALRAGHSLGAGFKLVADEMLPPINIEFGRVFEEQNLGIPMEQALNSLTDRVPNLDLKFFATAVILQRQTGGDLAEILDKIGHLIRERFKIWGQVQALTGEGRLSGIVLLALPPVLFAAVYRLNQEYVMVLFTDPMGNQMLAGAVVLQIIGALVIRKIINIKV
jgi:tight adherence protein B